MTSHTTALDAGQEALVAAVAFDSRGLVAAIAQDHQSGAVLMLAWMNETALRETLTTGRVCYWSRSRQSLWRKGESSGHVQDLVEARLDCDGDALLLLVKQTGPACHTNRPSCFYQVPREGGLQALTDPVETA
ncbi:MAG: phosphoribosyl-AMP cyclohydrolase [Pseudomonadota bacterium]